MPPRPTHERYRGTRMEQPPMDRSTSTRPSDRRGLQPLLLGPRKPGAALQWICGVLIGLTLLITLEAGQGGATSGEVLSFLFLAGVIGAAQNSARWLLGSI